MGAPKSLSERIEEAFDLAIHERRIALEAGREIRDVEANAKLEHREEWAGAKNNDVRTVLLAEWLSDHDEYWARRSEYETARDEFRLAMLEIERLRLLVEAAKVEGGRS